MAEGSSLYRYLYPYPKDLPVSQEWEWALVAWAKVREIDPLADWQWCDCWRGGLAFNSGLPPERFPFCEERYP